MSFPLIALSIRQPWCHSILIEGKDVENRPWPTDFRGQVLIHASKGVDPEDREDVIQRSLPLGGIVGVMTIVDCVAASESRWSCGPYGFVIRSARPLRLVPCKGALGFFRPNIDLGSLALA